MVDKKSMSAKNFLSKYLNLKKKLGGGRDEEKDEEKEKKITFIFI